MDSTIDEEDRELERTAGRPSGGRDRYELLEEIARGGTGRVSRANDRQLEREVAIKSLLDPTAAHALRFAREARVTARLQHPSVVPIYDIGRLADGEPYYAMKLVSGRTLDEAIRGCDTLVQRLALLPAFIGVADAIAYAHAQRVIHRDLKPHNVVLGPFGESLVIDWGLAKQLDDTANTEERPAEDPLGEPTLTLEGAVIGTPAYMPPEQACGRPVDERADVYSLGAMLYHLLAGRAPYRGSDARAVLVSVVEGPPKRLAELVDNVPDELQTIVAKAMAREAEDRYADAQQMVGDLHRFQTGQLVAAHRYTLWSHLRRFVRRYAAAVMVAAVLGAALVIGSVVAVVQIVERSEIAEEQRKAAEAARALALTQRDAAEELASFMLDDLRAELEPLGRLELLRGVGERVRGYYATLDAAGVPLDAAADRRRAQALAFVGEAELDAGDVAAALATFEQVRDVAERLGHLTLAARVDNRLGSIYRRRDERAIAAEYHTAAIVAAEAAGAFEMELGGRLGLAGIEQDNGDWAKAHEEAEHALALARALYDIDRDKTQLDLSEALMVATMTGRMVGLADASALLGEAREVMLDALDDDPYDTRTLAQLGRVDERIARFEITAIDAPMYSAEACELARRLRVIEPANTSFMRAQLSALEVDAAARGLSGDHLGALAGFREALGVARIAARFEPDNIDARRVIGYMRNRVGDAQYTTGDLEGAAETYRLALQEWAAVEANAPTVDGRTDIVHGHYDLGTALEELGRDDEALAEYGEAIALGDALVRETDSPESASYLGRALVAAAMLERDDREASRRHAARAIELLEPLPSRNALAELALQEARTLLR